jgi:hypothetical protein
MFAPTGLLLLDVDAAPDDFGRYFDARRLALSDSHLSRLCILGQRATSETAVLARCADNPFVGLPAVGFGEKHRRVWLAAAEPPLQDEDGSACPFQES